MQQKTAVCIGILIIQVSGPHRRRESPKAIVDVTRPLQGNDCSSTCLRESQMALATSKLTGSWTVAFVAGRQLLLYVICLELKNSVMCIVRQMLFEVTPSRGK